MFFWGVCLRKFLGVVLFFFFFNDTATTEIYTLSLHDALPISHQGCFSPAARLRRSHSTSSAHTAPVTTSSSSRKRAKLIALRSRVAPLQHREERFLRDLDRTDLLHALLSFLLFFEQLPLARDVAAV